MAPSVWFVLNLRKDKPSYLEVSGSGLALTDTSVVTVTDAANGLEWDVKKKWLHQGKLRLRLGGRRDPVPVPMSLEILPTPTTGTISVTVTNPPAGTILVQVAYVDEDPLVMDVP